MSRFSKSAAEKAGWRFTHVQAEERELRPRDSQGRSQVLPSSYIAEKTVDTPNGGDTLIHEEGETMGLLLERIHAWEEHQNRLEDVDPAPGAARDYPYGDISALKWDKNPKVATDKNGRDQADNELNLAVQDEPYRETVTTPDGNFDEHDFFNRHSEEAQVAHSEFLKRQRDFELAKPIDPTATKGERNEEVTPQDFGPPLPEIEILIAQAPGPERSEDEKNVTAKSKPADTEKEARKQAVEPKGRAGSKEQPAVPTHRGSDSPPEDVPKQKVEAPAKSPTAQTEKRATEQAVKNEPKETTSGATKARKAVEKKTK